MDVLLNISTLYRNTQKFLDSKLVKFNLGSGQYIFLMIINEHKGITANEICRIGNFDKSTTNKAIVKLLKEEYLITENDENDKRLKHLYLSDKANLIMSELYQYRKELNTLLNYGENDSLTQLAKNSTTLKSLNNNDLKVARINKLDLISSSNNIATTLYASGCNFKCPYCNQKDLVFDQEELSYLNNNEIFDFLLKNFNKIDLVVITGGEAIIQDASFKMIETIKEMGFKVKLETNGYFPEKLSDLLRNNLLDEVEMSVKSSLAKYSEATGITHLNTNYIQHSIDIIRNCSIKYNFRTVVYQELFDEVEIKELALLLKGSKSLILENYHKTNNSINKNLEAIKEADLLKYKRILEKEIDEVRIFGGAYVSGS